MRGREPADEQGRERVAAHALYRLAIVGIQHDPIIRAHYARKRAQGKSKMNAVGPCMKKGLAIVWGVWRSGEDFAAPVTH